MTARKRWALALLWSCASACHAALTVSGGAVYADEAAQPGFAMLTMPQSAPDVSMRDADDTVIWTRDVVPEVSQTTTLPDPTTLPCNF